jgi:hypothetical protein
LSTNEEVDNPEENALIPANVNILARTTQLVCLISYLAFASESIQDIAIAVETFPRFSKAEPDDKVYCMVWSCILRGIQGLLATCVVLLLIVTTSDVRDIILNFTAVNFVSAFDNIAFEQARLGKCGPTLEDEANRIQDAPAPACIFRKYRHVRNLSTVTTVGFIMMTLFAMVNFYQYSPNHGLTKRFRIQINKDNGDITKYSGCYDIVGGFNSQRFLAPRYLYESYETNPQEAKFRFCPKERRWYLFKGNETPACEAVEAKQENILARSEKTIAHGTYKFACKLISNQFRHALYCFSLLLTPLSWIVRAPPQLFNV